MYGALVVPTGQFGTLEGLHNTAIQQILGLDEIEEKFEEFHASALYHGISPFDGIPEEKRYQAIQVLLTAVKVDNLPYIYTAVDRKTFLQSPAKSAEIIDFAFHMCLLGVEDWATNNHPNYHTEYQGRPVKEINWKDMCLYIADDNQTNAELKKKLRKTYRILRVKRPFIPPHNNRLWHAHDEMYFGDSKDSTGIQIVDLCNYFMWMHLEGKEEPQGFYDIFAEQVICARPEPEWSTFRNLFRIHMAESDDGANTKGKAAQ
jgi:hypothetical protein